MNKIKIHTILRVSLLVGMCAYVTFLMYNKIQSSFDIDNRVFTEQIEIDTEENTEEEIDFQDEIKLEITYSVELFSGTVQKYKYYKNTRQYLLSSHVEHLTPPPKLFC